MNNTFVRSDYLNFIKRETHDYDDITRYNVYNFYEKILNFIIDYDNKDSLKELDYTMIKSIVKSDDTANIQYTLHLLSLEPYDVLNWVFYVENYLNYYEVDRIYIESEEMAEILQKESFYNPINGESVSKQQFSDLINTVFKVSENFISKLPNDGSKDFL